MLGTSNASMHPRSSAGKKKIPFLYLERDARRGENRSSCEKSWRTRDKEEPDPQAGRGKPEGSWRSSNDLPGRLDSPLKKSLPSAHGCPVSVPSATLYQ
ncbi:hypothetical protein JRQ81_014420 [Phrynocephalus forsythii]|uniref:Uncharacterized protein n=1 Tax=Phrynocephalus forsythii TaxID=171643 RepID=A0A9Q0XXQ3_9SAUR|nr:hypothetical protein JRQ81_014420 [Phrynocephalus forsythii]